MKTQTQSTDSLYDYDSPIKRADGQVPYNGYLWPTESWWPGHQPKLRCIGSRWHFGVIELADGRWSIEGVVADIKQDYEDQHTNKGSGRIVFETRTEAIRTAAARMLRAARCSMSWEWSAFGTLNNDSLAMLFNWTLAEVAAATSGQVRRESKLTRPQPRMPQPEDGLELWEFCKSSNAQSCGAGGSPLPPAAG